MYPDGFWTFTRDCGCVYGSLVGTFATPMQAWADFYDGDSKARRRAEAAGWSCRPAEPGDLERLGAQCPHKGVAA